MTRSEPRRHVKGSIRMRIWIAIMAIVIAVIASIWILQEIFLKDYTARIKRGDFFEVLQSVSDAVDERGIAGASNKLYEKVSNAFLCIVVIPDSGVGYKIEGLSYSCYTHQTEGIEAELLAEAQSSDEKYSIRQVTDPASKRQYFIGVIRSGTRVGGGAYTGIITQPLAPVDEAVNAIRRQMIPISILLVLAATLVAFLVARSMTKPLRRITDAARQIAEGNLNVTVDVQSGDEIGELGENFNTMSREISKVNTLQRELVANISHDMRTPLTMIRGYAEMIKDITGDDKAAREEQLDVIVDESNRLSTLVSDVMDLSLMQAGQSPMHLAPFDIAVKCRDILSRFRLLSQTQGFTFSLEAPAHAPVEGDEVRIEQVLYNLINNAVNHSGERRSITVRVLPQGGNTRVEVADTGEGIAQSDLPLIWNRYYKPYKKGQKQQGTGLGLSIVKAVLVNHKSEFGVNSVLGEGSTFWFTLGTVQGQNDD